MLTQIQKVLPYFMALGVSGGMRYLIKKQRGVNRDVRMAGIKKPILLRPGTSDHGVFYQIFIKQEYKIKLEFEPRVIVDGGANIGLSSVYFKNKYPDAHIIAIEPDDENFEMLRKNLAGYPNISLKNAGLWSKKMQTRVVDKYGLGKWAMVTEEVTDIGDDDSSFNTVTMSDIMEEFQIDYIDLLKLDIETAEKQLFEDNFKEWLSRTKVIIIELHDWMQDGCSKPFFKAINETFKNYSFGQMGENTVIVNRDLLPRKIIKT